MVLSKLSFDQWNLIFIKEIKEEKHTKGIFYERWVHSHGCRKWFNCVRDTSTDEILKTYKIDDTRPKLKDFKNLVDTPSGEPELGSGNFTVKK